MTRSAVAGLAVFLILSFAGNVLAQEYPNKSIRILAPGVGGIGDIISRLIAPGFPERLGQPMVIENRAPGILATEAAMKTPPDGYTLLIQASAFWVGPFLQKASYELLRDFLPISMIQTQTSFSWCILRCRQNP
jgi:tripartite-type tricarboxylate transporter receptor subunit TctC